MKRKLFVLVLLVSAFLFVACQPQDETPTPDPTPTEEPTPTPEQPVIIERPLNANDQFLDGCNEIDVVGEAGRNVCDPAGWDWNELAFSDRSPPPNVDFVRGDNPFDTKLRVRFDYLPYGNQYCLSQYEFLPATDSQGHPRNYVFKVGVDLVAPAVETGNRPGVELQLYTDTGNDYLEENTVELREVFLEDGYAEYLWVFDPVDDVNVHYQLCFNHRGVQASDQYYYITLARLMEASDTWGMDREFSIQ